MNFATFLALWTLPTVGLAERILAYLPVPAPSHHFFYQPILHGLAERGHQIDYYSAFPLKMPHENITHIQIENIWDDSWGDIPLNDHWSFSVLHQVSDLLRGMYGYSVSLCRLDSVQDLLKSNATYDMLLHESMYQTETSEVFQHKFNIPSVMLAAYDDFFQLNEFSGLLTNPSYMVPAFTEFSDNMNFFERVRNTYTLMGSLIMEYFHLQKLQRLTDECYTYPGWESRPPLSRLIANQSLILVNNHPSVGFPFPRPPHVKEIGGVVIRDRKPLPKDLENFINGASDGVIYFSLGTLFHWEKADPQLKDAFFKVFSMRKEKILWKLPFGRLEGLPSNVKTSHWFPQQDILGHPNVKLFITHGGLQSTFETVHYAKPVVVIPRFVDQFKNAMAIVQHGYGVQLMLGNITESSLTWALEEVLNHPKYKEQVEKGSALLKDKLNDPVDEAVYWIEHVLRHGKVLQPVGARLDFIERHCLDVIAFFLAVIFFAYYCSKRILLFLFSKNRFRLSNKKKLE